MFDKIHEECGVFGVYSQYTNGVAELAYLGLFALQHRGQESAGIATAQPRQPCSTRRGGGTSCGPAWRPRPRPSRSSTSTSATTERIAKTRRAS